MSFSSEWVGLIDYQKALDLQFQLIEKASTQKKFTILGLEHPSTITLGKRSDRTQDLLFSTEGLAARGLTVVETDRGGQATLHSPGQLVIYPIVDLREAGFGVKEYIQKLLEVSLRVLQSYGAPAFLNNCPGVYTPKGKIAFIGLRIEKGISRHGISINLNNDLSLFQVIKPCGTSGQKMDALAAYHKVSSEEFFARWYEEFLKSFSSVMRVNG